MNDDLASELLDGIPDQPGQIVYGVATATNTVAVRGATTAVTLPALTPVRSGDYCAVWERGGDRLILGPIGSEWNDITMASANWTLTRQPRWRYNGGRVEMSGFVTRINSSFGAGSTFFALGSGNPPVPTRVWTQGAMAAIAALTPTGHSVPVGVDTASGGIFRTASTAPTIAVGDGISFDGVDYPLD